MTKSADAANTAVRALLTRIGEVFYGGRFDTKGQQKDVWEYIRDEVFDGKCAFCGQKGRLENSYLIMMNREQCGFYHPGNIVPSCKMCRRNGRKLHEYPTWEQHLKEICTKLQSDEFEKRRDKILSHIAEQKYPKLPEKHMQIIRDHAQELYYDVQHQINTTIDQIAEKANS